MARPDRLAKNLVDASLELHRRRSWTKVPADAPFLIRVPTEEEPLAGVLIGQDGEELGLMVVKGPDAIGQLRRTFLAGEPSRERSDRCDFLSVSFERLGRIPADLRKTLDAAGFQARREGIAPFLFAKPAHRHLRGLNRGEMRTLNWCLAGVLGAEDQGELRPAPLVRGRKLLQLEVGGTPRAPEVKARRVSWSADEVAAGAAPALLPADLRELPRTDGRWIAGLTLVPGQIEGDERTLYAVLILDEGPDQILAAEVVAGGEPAEAVSVLIGSLRQHGAPREIVFTSEALMESAAPGLATLGVASSLDREEPLWSQAAARLIASLPERMSGSTPAERLALAEPRTLEDWKLAELQFTQVLVGDLLDRELLTSRAAKRYFGSEEDAVELQRELEHVGVIPAFIEWVAADYRPTRRSRTYVEKRLARKGLEPAERALLEARRDAKLSYYRVDSCEPGASLEVEDLLTGRRFTVQDRALSAVPLEGLHLPLRLLQVGDWYFPAIAGPPVSAFHIDRVLARLEDLGMTLAPDALRAEAHLLGRTWAWFLEQKAGSVELRNTDDDPLELHTAEFHAADPAALVSALEARDDVIVDEPGAEWTHVREGGPGGVGDTTTLCRLELFDDSLLVEVNSERRLERARAWIEKLPGVRFVSARRTDSEAEEARPMDDRLPGPPPGPLPPELIAELSGHMEEHAMRWLDEPVPALGELTPRAACATEEGRRRVARLVRTMPSMQVPGGEIPAPRERILRELRL